MRLGGRAGHFALLRNCLRFYIRPSQEILIVNLSPSSKGWGFLYAYLAGVPHSLAHLFPKNSGVLLGPLGVS